jgi:hypothetical protein
MIPIYVFEGKRTKILLPLLVLIAVCSIQILPTLGVVHLFDWDEINFAEAAREMVISGDYSVVQIGFRPFWEKPPLFFWMQALSMKMFGINEFVARFPNFISSVITLFSIYLVGSSLRNVRFALMWVALYFGSLLPNFYFHTGLIDPWYNLFSFLGFYFFWEARNRIHFCIYSGLFFGLAVLTKGPAVLLIFFISLTIARIIGYQRIIPSFTNVIVLILSLLTAGGSWFLYLILTGHSDVVFEFIRYQWRLFSTADAGHRGVWYYHFLVLLIGCFPASVFSIKKLFSKSDCDGFSTWMKILFWVNLLIFTLVKTKILHYSSLCYFPLTFLAADYLMQPDISRKLQKSGFLKILLQIIFWLLVAVLLLLPALILFLQYAPAVAERLPGIFFQQMLQMPVEWGVLDFLPALILAAMGEFGILKLIREGKILGLLWLHFAVIATIFSLSFTIIPKIEMYSQGKLVEFFRKVSATGTPVRTFYFKSYADLFYADVTSDAVGRNFTPAEYTSINTPLKFAVTKLDHVNKMQKEFPDFKLDSVAGGYAFYHSKINR